MYEQLKKEDIHDIMEKILYEFPLTMIEFYMPKWVEMLPNTHKMKADIIHDSPRTDFRCLGKRNLFCRPGRFYHPLRIVFDVSGSA